MLILSDSSLMPTGFSRVAHQIAMHLAKKNPLQGKGQNYTSGVFYQGMNSLHVPLKYCGYQMLQGGKWSRIPQQNMMAYFTNLYITKIKPDVIFTLLDARSVGYLPDLLKKIKYEGKWIFYYPLDMEFEAPWHKEYMSGIRTIHTPQGIKKEDVRAPDVVVCMSDFAYKIVKKWEGINKLVKIYHGYDSKVFKPREPDEEIIKDLKLEKYKHIIGYVSMNQFRKMTYRTLFAFKKVQKKMKNTCLLMHTPISSPGIGWNIPSLMDAFSIKNVIVNPLANLNLKTGVPDEYISRFYSVMDTHLLLTGGEGTGLTILESLAMGIPNIVTNYTTGPELLGNNERGFLVKVKAMSVGLTTEYRALADINDASKKLLILLKDDNLREKMGKNATKFIKKRHSWPIIFRKWDKLLKKI